MAKPKPGRAVGFDAVGIEERWIEKTKSIKDIFKMKGVFWLMVPAIPISHYLQHVNDVHMVEMVRYNVKLYPNKPKVTIWHF